MLAVAVVASDLAAQDRKSFQNPAEYDNYMSALNTRDAAKRATAMEVFAAWYPTSVLRIDAYEQAMAAWQAANQPDKADFIAGKLLQVDPDNVHSLAYRVYVGRMRAVQGDRSAISPTTTWAVSPSMPAAPRMTRGRSGVISTRWS